MCRIAKIDRFLYEWPNAEFGPGHIVLSDANLDDECLDMCIQALDALLDGGPWPEHFGEPHWWSDNDRAQLAATRTFLRELRALPEDARVETGDELCVGWI